MKSRSRDGLPAKGLFIVSNLTLLFLLSDIAGMLSHTCTCMVVAKEGKIKQKITSLKNIDLYNYRAVKNCWITFTFILAKYISALTQPALIGNPDHVRV